MAKYYFTIQLMSPHPQAIPRYTPRGTWVPPKALGANLRRYQPIAFRHNGQAARTTNDLPDELEHYSTYSLYYSQGFFWVVPYDATTAQIHDGDERSNPDDSTDSGEIDSDYQSDWAEVKFGSAPGNATYLSYARPGLASPTLLVQRQDQRWAHYFLPDRYQSAPRSIAQGYGGLVGDLALLLGLVSMSLPAQSLAQELPSCLSNPWRIPNGLETRVPRGTEWHQRKGIVVTVYNKPSETAPEELQQYERGYWGAIFP